MHIQATADSFVVSTSPNANRGTSAYLRVREQVQYSYLRFTVPTVPSGEDVVSATLKVFAKAGARCSLGVDVLRAADDTWKETTITWNNQPGSVGSVLDNEQWSTKGYRSFNVTAAVGGAGPVSFMLRHAAGCAGSTEETFSSREVSTKPPELLVETGPGVPDPACSDGVDNDADALIDFPSDAGCTDASDNDETDPTKILAAAGDLVCGPDSTHYDGTNPLECQHRLTDDLLAGADAVAPLGDLQYPDGRLDYFVRGYDPTWGQYASVTYPTPGNHEYNTAGAQGYFDYWSSKGRPTGVAGDGYYSFDLGAWHVIVLNSSRGCTTVPCADGSPQNDWLEADLAATSKRCILAYWHHPRFNSGSGHTETHPAGALWDDLYAARADVILNGHEHSYQRYAKQNPFGQAVSNGIRQFIVGSGGRSLTPLGVLDPNFEFGNATDFGVLKLALASNSYSWQFVGVTGAVLDSGGPAACN